MSCKICGRTSCTESFHSIEEQEEFDKGILEICPEAKPFLEEIDKAGLIAENVELQKNLDVWREACNVNEKEIEKLQEQADLLTYGLLQEKKENSKLKEALSKINILNANKDNDITWLIEQALKLEEQDNEQHKS